MRLPVILLLLCLIASAQVYPPPTSVNSAQGSLQTSVNGIANQNIPTVPVLYYPNTDLICAAGNDPTINLTTISVLTRGTTTQLTVGSNPDPRTPFLTGAQVWLSGFAQNGYNNVGSAAYTVLGATTTTGITINLDSSALVDMSGGSPAVSLACTNSADSTSTRAFATTYSIPAGTFIAAGKQLELAAGFAGWSAASTTGTNFGFRFKIAAATLYGGTPLTPMTANRTDFAVAGIFRATARQSVSTVSYLDTDVIPPMWPGWTSDNLRNLTNGYAQQVNTSVGTQIASFEAGWTATGIPDNSYTYASGGSFSGTGNCLLTATNGGGSGAVGLMAIASGSATGAKVRIGPTFAQTNTGSGYSASQPTTWTASVPTISPADTCSGTVTTTGSGGLVGAFGNALMLKTLRISWWD